MKQTQNKTKQKINNLNEFDLKQPCKNKIDSSNYSQIYNLL
jgi:hypothetical protein